MIQENLKNTFNKKEDIDNYELLKELGLEPWDDKLMVEYLKVSIKTNHYQSKQFY